MSEVFSVLLHNRQRYEQGKEGLWFSLPTTTEKLQAALREIGISTDNPQDFFLYGYRSPQKRPIKLPRDMVLSAGMDELNFLAARLEKLDATELTELNAALTSPQSDFHNIGQIIDYPENVDFYVHLPDVTGTGQLGDYYLNRSGMVDMPEEWKAGIFLPRFGLHIANTEHGVFTDYGYLVKSGDEWQRVHEGQPVPEEYRVMAYPAPEILREESKVQPEAAALTKAPQPVTPILLNGQNSAERMKEITDRLETGIQELFESERYKAAHARRVHDRRTNPDAKGPFLSDRQEPGTDGGRRVWIPPPVGGRQVSHYGKRHKGFCHPRPARKPYQDGGNVHRAELQHDRRHDEQRPVYGGTGRKGESRGTDFSFGCGRGSQGGGQKAQADPKDDAETKETVHPGAACRRQGGTEKEAPGAGKIKRNGGMRNVFHRGRRKPDLSVPQRRPPQDGGKSPGSFAGHGQGNGGAFLPDRR